ncbi:MAG: hypothetical protein FWH04_09985, partial [Oscillospiraceae bacterium]|nr:hypothetical protein [Oscillospiraceae bacterium]
MNKRILSIVIVLMMTASLLFFPPVPVSEAVPDGAAGYGSNGKFLAPIDPPDPDAIKIYTEQDLWDIRDNLDSSGTKIVSYVLMNDLDLSLINDGEWIPISGWFRGVFDGQGFVIRNLKISSNNRMYVGLFERTGSAIVKNIGLENTYININRIGATYVGGLIANHSRTNVSNCYNSGDIAVSSGSSARAGGLLSASGGSVGSSPDYIRDCYNTGNVSATGSSASAGGISSNNMDSPLEISNCYNTGNITATATSAYDFRANAGGILGQRDANRVTSINNCYNTGNISASISTSLTASASAGGIVGFIHRNTDSFINNCYNVGSVSVSSPSATSRAGAIFGGTFDETTLLTLTNVYYNSDAAQTVNGTPQDPKRGVGDLTNESDTTPLTTAQ